MSAEPLGFIGLVDLAAERLGGRVVGTSDDFFAGAGNLIKPGRGVFVEGKFTERGKWMDGWESRRKRSPGHDWCVLELGTTGQILGLDIDTNHFVGNAPSFASVEALRTERGTSLDVLDGLPWRTLVAPSALRPGSQNLFACLSIGQVSHVRLNIFPDGGVARFRVFGRVEPAWEDAPLDEETARHVPAGLVDLAAVVNGGLALACSDAFFGPMNNLLMPGRAENMGDGWETRRRRGPGHDWIVVQLGARGIPRCLEVDTRYFIGNYPDRCSIERIDAEGTTVTDLIASSQWMPLLAQTRLRADARHYFEMADGDSSATTHLRMNIFPDGGVSRLRVWGSRT